MKKILLLGGSAQQVIAIETAKRLGYYTVLCDYLSDNPGQYVADKFYLVSTTDKQAILQVAKEEKIDGVLAYASDPAAPTAAYVAESLGLPGNPYQSVEILCNKDRFREFLAKYNFCVPKSKGYESVKDAIDSITEYSFPVIIKPVDSSGSKGVTVVHSMQNAPTAITFAFSFSRSHRIIIEEFVEKKHKYLIGGDVFIYNGKIVQWGLMNCHRDSSVNPLVPVGKSYPVLIGDCEFQNAKRTLQSMVDKLGLRAGAMNVELIIDKQDRVFLIDIGPRSGGNMIPDLLSMIFNVDVVEMSIKVAMGVSLNMDMETETGYYATHNVHAQKNGIFMGIEYSDNVQPYLIKECLYKQIGDKVEYFENSAKALGIVFFKFPDQQCMDRILGDINSNIVVKVQ